MKKIYKKIVFSLLLFVFTGFNAFSQKVTLEQAQHVALNLMYEKSGNFPNKLTVTNEARNKNTSEKFYYTFNFNGKGFVHVAANKVAFPILGYSLSGSCNVGTHSPAYAEWMQSYENQIKEAIKTKVSSSPEIKKQWGKYLASSDEFKKKNSVKTIVEPLFGADGNSSSIKYNQNPYYNDDCPGGSYAGCVATAMSQLMVFYNHPNKVIGYREYVHTIANGFQRDYGLLSANFNENTYNIASLPNSISSANADVAKFSYHVGVSVLMDFSTSVSLSYMQDAAHALITNWDFDKTLEYKYKGNYDETPDLWEGMLRTSIDNGEPIIYSGVNSTKTSGHAWVCDGYNDVTDEFHFNWGWGGADNGFYPLTAIEPGSNDFSTNQCAILGVRPNFTNIKNIVFEDFEEESEGNTGLVQYISRDWNTDAESDEKDFSPWHDEGNTTNYYYGSQYRNQWLGSPKIGLPTNSIITLSFQLQRYNSLGQQMSVFVSTTGNLSTDFSNPALETFTLTDSWIEHSLDLSAYAGQNVYIGIKTLGDDDTDQVYCFLDDLLITSIEIQTTIWNGSEWLPNAPTASSNAIINGNYSENTNFSCNDLIINNAFNFEVLANKTVTVNGNLTNNGLLLLKSDNNSTAPTGALITKGTITNNGEMSAQKYLTTPNEPVGNANWHLVGTPLNTNTSVENIFLNDYVYQYTQVSPYWNNLLYQIDKVEVNKAYLVQTLANNGKNVVFTGTFKTGAVEFTLSQAGDEWNLITNPFPSAIDLDQITISEAITDFYTYSAIAGNYLLYNTETNGPSIQYVQSMQGFFAGTSNASKKGEVLESIITIPNTARVENSVFAEVKQTNENSLNLLQFTVNNSVGKYDEVLINFAKKENQSAKLFSFDVEAPQIYVYENSVASTLKTYVDADKVKIVPIAFESVLSGVFTFNVNQFSFTSEVLLHDIIANAWIRLNKNKSYEFSHTAEAQKHRFDIYFNSKPTDIKIAENTFATIYSHANVIYINLAKAEECIVKVFDLSGRVVICRDMPRRVSTAQTIQIPALKVGTYIVKVATTKGIKIEKVLVK